MKKIKNYIIKHYFASQLLISLAAGFTVSVVILAAAFIKEAAEKGFQNISAVTVLYTAEDILPMAFVFALMAFPFVLTFFETIYLVSAGKNGQISTLVSAGKSAAYDCVSLAAGMILGYILLSYYDVMFDANWDIQLANRQLHAPVSPDSALTFAVFFLLFFAGMLIIALKPQEKKPPLITVLCIAMMYIGTAESVLFSIQITGANYVNYYGEIQTRFEPFMLFIYFIPLNMILIMIRIMLIQIKSYVPDENRMSRIDSIPFLSKCNKLLQNSKSWPLAAFVMTVPLLGIVIVILALFGQAPDAAIKAYTETADYTFSTKIPPQNIFYDEHYLCTVAAGGHKKVVKPLRMGKRHGHDVVVNRQLLIANAFEQVLEERTPRFHRAVRHFYDTYGFPVAKLIKTKTAADIVWFLMKPLEWIFLFVLYLADVNPEDRIASQYL